MRDFDDELLFADDVEEEEELPSEVESQKWRVLIVDDDAEVHSVTKFALSGFELGGKTLEFLDAYSRKEAVEVLQREEDIALILLDVVMEDDEAGLKCVKDIRETLGNNLVRIVLRTGQPGQAPEKSVIINYDINDYKTKGELTSQKLFTTVVSSLRSYQDLEKINKNKRALEDIIDATSSMYEVTSMEKFISGILTQILTLLNLNNGSMYSSDVDYFSTGGSEEFQLLASTNKEKSLDEKNETIKEDFLQAVEQGKSLFLEDRTVIYFKSKNDIHNIIYVEGKHISDLIERNMLEIFCANASTAFDNLHLKEEIEETQREVIFLLGDVAESHSEETGQHAKRVSYYCEVLGKAYGLKGRELELLKLASPLHDIGKISISDEIINKPAALSEEEFTKIKEHPFSGYEILRNSKREIMQAASIIARDHHEKFNGKGYPSGLKGEDIHIYGRICAIADVFDALAFDRVYKKAWSFEKIKDLFNKERGESFDPKLVDLFFENFDKFVEIKEKFSQ